jgi:hypothetical protein
MAKIPAKLRLDKKLEGDAERVQELLDDVYLDIAPNLNLKADMIIMNRNPTVADNKSDLGSMWLNSINGNKFMLTSLPSTWTAF